MNLARTVPSIKVASVIVRTTFSAVSAVFFATLPAVVPYLCPTTSAVTPAVLDTTPLLVSTMASPTIAAAPTVAMPTFPAALSIPRPSGDKFSTNFLSPSLFPTVCRPEMDASQNVERTAFVPSLAHTDARLAASENAMATIASRSVMSGFASASTQPFIFFPALSICPSITLFDLCIPISTNLAPVAIRTAASSPLSTTRRIRSYSISSSLKHFARNS
mmetsp:Transcript_283/g.482  ORF Transcript_283/g.482 Transcript_283/m.482 type:complete len:219 (+) Transcript_283:1791-2447(+)